MAEFSETTFGRTPAAMYLARELKALGSDSMTRNVGKQITATSRAVNDLLFAYSEGALSPKTVANCLRLMRQEVSYEVTYFPSSLEVEASQIDKAEAQFSKERLISQLRRNVQIGMIKRGLRLCTVARKAEHVMASPEKRSSSMIPQTHLWRDSLTFQFFDSSTQAFYDAGTLSLASDGEVYVEQKLFSPDEINDITPDTLIERSERRCIRLKKPHTVKE